MSDTDGGNWFDRLAVRSTRREAFKAAALSGAALALPLALADTARAADPHACQQGCNWTAHQRYLARLEDCHLGAAGLGFSTWLGVGGIFSFNLGLLIEKGAESDCADRTLITQKAAQFDCMKPDCPGFDPKAAGGPCETCTSAVGSCCPDPMVVGGYSCCTLGCACSGDDVGACHGSTTPC